MSVRPAHRVHGRRESRVALIPSGLLTVHVPQELVLQCALRLDDEQINHTAAIAARRAQLKSRPPELSRGAHEACTLACGVRRYEVGGVA